MKKNFLWLSLVFLLINLTHAQQIYYIQLGPEINFTQADSVDKQVTVKSFTLSAIVNQKLNEHLSIGAGYSFGRAWHRSKWVNLHKYILLATLVSHQVSYSVVYEYFYAKLPNLNISGGGLGVKINLNPFKANTRLSFFLSANIKNQALGFNYLF